MPEQDGDETVIYDSVQAFTTLQNLYGIFPRIVGKGDFAKVRDLLNVYVYNMPKPA